MLPDLTGTKEIVELAKPLLGSPVKELGELLADRVRFWRWKSTVKIIKMANEIRQKEHIGRKEVPLKVFLPLIEEASKESEDQDEVCQLWARLLATSDKETTGFDLVCIDMLKFIGPLEAILLNYVYSSRNKRFRVDTELATIIDEKYGGCNDELTNSPRNGMGEWIAPF